MSFPPAVHLGDSVQWHDGRNTEARAHLAWVTAVGRNGIVDLFVIPVSSYNGFPRSGVRHVDDPDKRVINSTEDGVWSHIPREVEKSEPEVSKATGAAAHRGR